VSSSPYFRSITDPLLKSRQLSDTFSVVTANYRAPEILKKKHYNILPVDVWSLGVTIFQLLDWPNLPFDVHNAVGITAIIDDMDNECYTWSATAKAAMGPKAMALVDALLNPDPKYTSL
jgi:serine/threonine protein kinase